ADLAEAVFAIQPGLNEQLIEIVNEIADIADRDCYGDDRGDLKDPCTCETCSAKRAIALIERIRRPAVRSLREERLTHAERVYFEGWVKQNTRSPGINGGHGA